jgi:GH15 family glucan-1,4-alpha-glucosidase
MYGIGGERWLPENEITWLGGYEGSSPVRIGNGAADQVQLDVFGEITLTLHTALDAGLVPLPTAGDMATVMLDHLESIWQTLDHGIWEVRGPRRAFTHSRMMCWVAFDRAIKSSVQFGYGGAIDRWRRVRKQIHADICKQGFNEKLNSFTQYYGGETLDASLLLMPRVGFLPPDDPRILGTIKAIEKRLLKDGFVMRYATEHVDDGVGGSEGSFLACSFWLADAYVLTGRRRAAIKMFDRLLSLRNDLGLLSEEYDPVRKRLIGNFPQAFSHLGLINTAHYLAGTHNHDTTSAKRSANKPRKSTKVTRRRTGAAI